MPIVVGDVVPEIRKVYGQADQQTIYRVLTDAVVALAPKFDWDPLIGYMDICTTTDGRTLTLPPEVDTPLCVNIGGHPAMFRSRWFEFHFNSAGSGAEVPWAWDDRGDVVMFMDIISPSMLVAIADLKTDLGVALRIFGKDQSMKDVATQNADGSWQSGYVLPINQISDFPGGLIVPSPNRIQKRNFGPNPFLLFNSPAHQFQTGVLAALGLVTPPLPTPLQAGLSYFIGVPLLADGITPDPDNFMLYATRSAALTNVNPIALRSISAVAVISLTDQRVVAPQTKFNTGATPHNILPGSSITFTGSPLPMPLVASGAGSVGRYFAFPIDALNFTAHQSQADAIAGLNPVDVSTPGFGVQVNASQPMRPTTFFQFSTAHNMLQGDAVFVTNSGGTLPAPLLPSVAYYVRYLSPTTLTLHNTLDDATSGANPIVLTSAGSGQSSLVKSIAATILGNPGIVTTNIPHNLGAGDFISFTSSGTLFTSTPQVAVNTNYKVGNPITTNSFEPGIIGYPSVGTSTRARTTNVATIVTAAAHGFATGDLVDVSGMTDTSFNATRVQVTVTNATTFTYANTGPDVVSGADVGGTVVKDPGLAVTGGGTGQLYILVQRAFSIGFDNGIQTDTTQLITGSPVNLGSTGSLPAANPPVTNLTTYYARVLTSDKVGKIQIYDTLARSQDTTVRISASRARATNVATIVTGAAHGLLTGDFVDISGLGGTGYNVNRVQITVTNATTFTYANTGGNEGTTADVNGQIIVSAIYMLGLGSGALSVVLQRAVTVQLRITVQGYPPLLAIAPNDFLQDLVTVQFTTDGSLPTPLLVATNYKARIIEGQLQILDAGSNPVTLTNIGSGNHKMVAVRNATPVLPTSISCPSNVFNTGDAVVVRTAGVAPSPLVAGTTYYLRRIDSDHVEIYDTLGHATAAPATTGRIVLLNVGTGQSWFEQTVTNIQVSKATRVSKGVSNGPISVYALDPGRANALTLIGVYGPQDTEPTFRRIRILNQAAPFNWVRMRYRKRFYKIQSDQDIIPINSKRSVIMMVKAIKLEDTDYYDKADQARELAFNYALEDQKARQGPETVSLQVDGDVFTDPCSKWMT